MVCAAMPVLTPKLVASPGSSESQARIAAMLAKAARPAAPAAGRRCRRRQRGRRTPRPCYVARRHAGQPASRRKAAMVACQSALPNTAEPATKVSAPASAMARMLSGLTPPSTSSRTLRPVASACASSVAAPGAAWAGGGDEALATEAGVHAHQHHQVEPIQHMVQPLQRRGRVEHQAGLAALVADQLQRAITCRLASGWKADQPGAGLGEHRHQRIDRLAHQVHVEQGRAGEGLPTASAPSGRRLGTWCWSITSKWIQSAPAAALWPPDHVLPAGS